MNLFEAHKKGIGKENWDYIEKDNGDDTIEITLKIIMDKNKKTTINYINKCNEKNQCLATKIIRDINKSKKQ